jgi:DNA processing protein
VIDPEELGAWLRLLAAPGLGREAMRRLLATFGSPQAVFQVDERTWTERVGHTRATALAQPQDDLPQRLLTTLQWLAADHRRSVVPLGDPSYPQRLLETADPPLLLYAQGRIELLSRSSIAMVGSRNATRQGEDNARAFATHFSRAGLAVVSGLALGIDGAAHEGGLAGPGSTIAVVGTGLDRVYPKAHLALAHRIAEQGLLISEFALGTEPLARHFPSRNRIIAGLSLGTLVVEAAPQSGSLITARQAAEMGREVFAIPGSIHSPQSRGCHDLIKQGAKLVDRAEDVLEELRLNDNRAPLPATRAETTADPLLEALGYEPATLDALIARTGMPPPQLNVRLLELELDGQVARLPGGLFQRRATL